MAASLRQPEAWQHDMQTLLSLAQQVVESHLAENRHLTSEQRTAYRTGIHTGFDVAAHILAGSSVEIAAEILSGQAVAGHALKTDMTGWIGLQQSAEHLESLLNTVSSVSTIAPAPIGLTRHVAYHHGTPLHRLRPVPGESAASLFLAAEESLLAWHVGSSPVALMQVLDRRRTHAQTPVFPRPQKKILHLECPLSFCFELFQHTQPEASRDELVAAAQWLREVTTPMLLEVAPQPNAATLRWVLPQALLQGVADVFRQHIVQTLRQSLLGY
jgi:hypothetical protein